MNYTANWHVRLSLADVVRCCRGVMEVLSSVVSSLSVGRCCAGDAAVEIIVVVRFWSSVFGSSAAVEVIVADRFCLFLRAVVAVML